MKNEQFIEKAYKVFSKFEKPGYCTRYPDFEDAEFNEVLISVTNRELSIEQVGIITWSPIPCMNPEALSYFMPRLIELAINGEIDPDGDPFYCRFINYFHNDLHSEKYRLFGTNQKLVMATTFELLCQNYREQLEFEGWFDEARQAAIDWKRT